MNAKVWNITLVLILLGALLAGCGTAATAADAESVAAAEGVKHKPRVEGVLNEDYDHALPASSQLALGTFLLEGTENAVSAEQAKALLPLWQIIESGALKSEDETGAVLRQIEGAMTPEQLSAIAGMQLTFEDMTSWAQTQGVSLGGPGGGDGGFAPPESMTQEQWEEMRAAREAGGGISGEDRAAMRATAEANGMTRPDGAGMGGGQIAALAGPLVELLSQLAAG
jgi:hypothetical protein